jgi:hypothetical protein
LWRGLVAVFPLWEGSGVPYEVIGNNRPTIGGDPDWIATSHGLGIAFDGTNDRYAYTQESRFNVAHTTIFGYARFAGHTDATNKSTLYGKEWNDPWHGLAYLEDAGGGVGRMYYDTGASNTDVDGTTDLPDTNGGVHTLAGTYDGAVGRLYVDGVEEGTNSTITGDLSMSADQPTIGASSLGTASEFVGDIYCVYLWDRALSAADIRLLHLDPFGLIRPSVTIEEAGATSTPFFQVVRRRQIIIDSSHTQLRLGN